MLENESPILVKKSRKITNNRRNLKICNESKKSMQLIQ